MSKELFAAAITAFVILLISASTVFLQDSQGEAPATEEFFNYTVHFCQKEDCLRAFASQLKSAKASIRCALYGIDGSLLSDLAPFYSLTAANTSTEIIVDKNSKVAERFVQGKSGSSFVLKRNSKGIMHDKYCIVDNTIVLTGSFNPTAAAKNDYNNMLIINSTSLALFYNGNFEKLKSSTKETQAVQSMTGPSRPLSTWEKPTTAAVANKGLKQKTAVLNKTAVEVYFCPEDGCLEAVKNKLRMANGSIIFAAYSFTHPEIANELILKRSEGVAVAGVIEKSTTGSKYSKHAMMAANGINVRLESSKRLMHHKFFVIDNRTVITGSFNPTENADTRNDENIIIIENPAVAEEYVAEFHRIYGDTIVTE